MKKKLAPVLAVFSSLALMPAQQPKSAHVKLYFAQVADGGPAEGKWQTAFRFLNLSPFDATVTITLYNQGGSRWAIDLGSGLKDQNTLMVPSLGSRVVRSAMTSATVQMGWAEVSSTQPVVGLASFTMWSGGKALQEVTTPSAQPTMDYDSYATGDLGVAIANPFSYPVTVKVSAADEDGGSLGSGQTIELPVKGHTVFNVRDKFPLFAGKSGWIEIVGRNIPADRFIAWTMNADPSGTFASLPDGGQKYPQVHEDRIALAFARLMEGTDGAWDGGLPRLTVTKDQFVMANVTGSSLTVSVGAAELLNDSEDELAALLAHLLGHALQNQNGGAQIFSTDRDTDAEAWSVIVMLVSFYDPYAIGGLHGKLHAATVNGGSQTLMENKTVADEHAAVHTRSEKFLQTISNVCNLDSTVTAACTMFKKIYHPSLPGMGVLTVPPPDLDPFRKALRRVAQRAVERF